MQKQTVRLRRTPRVATNAQIRTAITELRLIQEASATGVAKNPYPANIRVNGVSTSVEWNAALDAVCGHLVRIAEERTARTRAAAIIGKAKKKARRQLSLDLGRFTESTLADVEMEYSDE